MYPYNDLVEYIPEFIEEFKAQIESDKKRWGDTWMKRSIEGQEERTELTFMNYFDQYKRAGVPIPWLKIIGNAFICWIREKHIAKN